MTVFHWLITYFSKILKPSPLQLSCLNFLVGKHVSEFWLLGLIQNKLSINVSELIDWLIDQWLIDSEDGRKEGRECEDKDCLWLIVLMFKNTFNPVWNCTIWNWVLTWLSSLTLHAHIHWLAFRFQRCDFGFVRLCYFVLPWDNMEEFNINTEEEKESVVFPPDSVEPEKRYHWLGR